MRTNRLPASVSKRTDWAYLRSMYQSAMPSVASSFSSPPLTSRFGPVFTSPGAPLSAPRAGTVGVALVGVARGFEAPGESLAPPPPPPAIHTPAPISTATANVPHAPSTSGEESLAFQPSAGGCATGAAIGAIEPRLPPAWLRCGPRFDDDAVTGASGDQPGMLPLLFIAPASVGRRPDELPVPVRIVNVRRTLANWSALSKRSVGFFEQARLIVSTSRSGTSGRRSSRSGSDAYTCIFIMSCLLLASNGAR